MAQDIDLSSLSDEALDAHCIEVRSEQERRQRLAMAPDHLAALVNRYAEDGGDPTELLASVPTASA